MNKDNPKLKTWILILVLVLITPIMFITMTGRESTGVVENFVGNIVRPVQRILSSVSFFISEKTYPIRHMFSLSEENERLKKELLTTRKQLIEQTMLKEELADLKELRKANNYSRRQTYDNAVAGDIVARDPNNYYNMFVVDVGASKGVIKNSMVFDANGLIGQVYECGDDWAKVVSLTNSKTGVSFRVLDASRTYDGVVYGNGTNMLEGFLFDVSGDVAVGDILITSGVGIYPSGVVIGEVSEISDLSSSLLPSIKVKPFVNFKRIDRVLIIPPHVEYTEDVDDER